MVNTIVFILKELLHSSLRVEKKLDELLTVAKDQSRMYQPLGYSGQVDPLSKRPVNYQKHRIDDGSVVVVRRDGNTPQSEGLPGTVGDLDD